MKEDITRYKGANSLVGISFKLGHLSYFTLILTVAITFFNDLNPSSLPDWKAALAFISLPIVAVGLAVIPLAIEGMLEDRNFNYSEPCTIYASKRWVRSTVVFSSVMGAALMLSLLTIQSAPTLSTSVSSTCYGLSLFGVILIIAQTIIPMTTEVPTKMKPDRKNQPNIVYLSPFFGGIACTCISVYKHVPSLLSTDIGASLSFLLTVSAISLLWFEDKKSGMADREIIPLCTASILWIVSALVANYAYASLASVTFVLPYLVYFLPLILLGFYYYVTAPEES
jgi:hypothetical protein